MIPVIQSAGAMFGHHNAPSAQSTLLIISDNGPVSKHARVLSEDICLYDDWSATTLIREKKYA